MSKFFLVFVVPVCMLQAADVITGVIATSSSAYADRGAGNLVGTSGLHADGTHDCDVANNKMWMSTEVTDVRGQWVKFNLNGIYALDSVKIWNFNWNNSTTFERPLKTFRLYRSDEASDPGSTFTDASKWQEILPPEGDVWTINRPVPPSGNYTGESPLSLGGVRARWVALYVESNFGDAKYVGLSKVQFYRSAVPAILNAVVTTVHPTSAEMKADIVLTESAAGLYTTLLLCRPETSSTWMTNVVGTTTQGTAFATAVGLSPDTIHVAQFVASSAAATYEGPFLRFDTGAISAHLSANSVSEDSLSPVTLTLSRPASCARAATFTLTVSGTAQARLDYTPAFPAAVTMTEGQTTATLDFTLIDNSLAQPNRTLTVSMGATDAVIDGTSTATLTILDNDAELFSAFGWKYAMPVDFTGYTSATTGILTNFVAAIRLSEDLPGFRYADFQPAAADLRFADAGRQILTHEIDTWNTAGQSLVWVQIPFFDLQNPPLIHAFWGNPGAPVAAYTTSRWIWLDGFNAVYHLNDATDASLNANNGTSRTSSTVDGLLGKAQYFNNVNGAGNRQRISVPSSTSLAQDLGSTVTWSLWMYPHAQLVPGKESVYRMLEKDNQYFVLQGYGDTALGVLVKSGSNSENRSLGVPDSLASNQWIHVCGQVSNNNLRLYINGEPIGEVPAPGKLAVNDNPLCIGSDWTENNDAQTKFFHGLIDEVRIERVARSAGWIALSYANQKDNASVPVFGDIQYAPPATLFFVK